MLGYRHCGVEALVDADNGGNLIVQPSIVEKWLLMRHRTSTNNHSLAAYRDCTCRGVCREGMNGVSIKTHEQTIHCHTNIGMEACFDPQDLVLYLPKVLGQENRTSADDDLPEWLLGSRRSTHLI